MRAGPFMHELLYDALAEFLGGVGVALSVFAVTWAYRRVKAVTRAPRPGDPDPMPEPPRPAERPGGHGTR
ncbi:hypothetical protein ACFXHD_23160 [Streptomyces hydrogenans]|uniref:hypothetical protein n=1 Tax=Streptomyces hydrogenans TaxID=1873719 RepID=UPI0036758178